MGHFGLSVTGIVHPEKFWRNVGATPGNVLILTKPLGIGLLTTGIKRNAVTPEQAKAATESMSLLNKQAALVLEQFSPTAVTDVTGFGLLGHGSEMARGSDASLVFYYNQIPILDGALDLVTKKVALRGSAPNPRWFENLSSKFPILTRAFEGMGKGVIPGGSKSNHRWLENDVDYQNISLEEQLILCDSITSGGLLISLPPIQADEYMKALKQAGQDSWIVGEVINKQKKLITVKR